MKRILTFTAIFAVAAGAATAAWAHPGGRGDGGPRREALRACVQEAKAANPDADKETLKPIVKSCMEAKGYTVGEGGDRAERRAKFRECREQAKAAHPDDRQAARQAFKECMSG